MQFFLHSLNAGLVDVGEKIISPLGCSSLMNNDHIKFKVMTSELWGVVYLDTINWARLWHSLGSIFGPHMIKWDYHGICRQKIK